MTDAEYLREIARTVPKDGATVSTDRLKAIAANIEALERDAGRYQFIRQFNEESQRVLFGEHGNDEMPWGADLDAAIDAAIERNRTEGR